MTKEKKLVYVSKDIIDEITRITRRKGTFISKFVEESLNQAIKLEDMGYSIEEAAEAFEVIRALRVLGGVFTPQEVLECLARETCRANESLLEKWYEAGILYGKYLKEKFHDPLLKLRKFLEIVRWDLNEVNVKHDKNLIKLVCVSVTHNHELTEALARFVEGVVTGLGYHVQKKEVMKSLILLEFNSMYT